LDSENLVCDVYSREENSVGYPLAQWSLNLTFTNTPNPYVVIQAFVEPHFCPI